MRFLPPNGYSQNAELTKNSILRKFGALGYQITINSPHPYFLGWSKRHNIIRMTSSHTFLSFMVLEQILDKFAMTYLFKRFLKCSDWNQIWWELLWLSHFLTIGQP